MDAKHSDDRAKDRLLKKFTENPIPSQMAAATDHGMTNLVLLGKEINSQDLISTGR